MDNNYSKGKHTFSKPYISVSDETGFLSGQIIYYLPPTPQPSKWCVPSGVVAETLYVFLIYNTFYMPSLPNTPGFYHTNRNVNNTNYEDHHYVIITDPK